MNAVEETHVGSYDDAPSIAQMKAQSRALGHYWGEEDWLAARQRGQAHKHQFEPAGLGMGVRGIAYLWRCDCGETLETG